tara:strand:- start:949 stop:1113 length:165 start_codon:yes stop_codon:yes gene_type:complete
MTKQEQQKLIEELKDDVFELRQELLSKNELIEKLKRVIKLYHLLGKITEEVTKC